MASKKTTKTTYREVTSDDLTMRLYPSDKGSADYYGTLSVDTASGSPLAIKINVYDKRDMGFSVFVSFPSYKSSGGEYVDLVFPRSKELRDTINELAAEVVSKF